MGGRVSFVGAGPGAADLITLRGARLIAEADVVVWPANLVEKDCVRHHAGPAAQLVDSSLVGQEEVLAVYRRAAVRNLSVVRLLAGDPALWSGVREQVDACAKLGLATEIVPGVSGFAAAAAAVGRELTLPDVTQSVVLTRLSGGLTATPERERIRELASHGTTMAVVLSAARIGQLAEELRAGGYPEDTPVVVASKTTRPDEVVLHTTLAQLEATVKQHKLWRHALVLVGAVLGGGTTRSRRYGSGQTPAFRKARTASAGTADAAGSTETPSGTRRARPTQWSLRAGRRAARRANPPQQPGNPNPGVPQVGSQPGSGHSEQSTVDKPRRGRAGAAGPEAVYWATRSSGGVGQGGASAADATGAVGEGKPASAAAWSAVRGWQETARANGRSRGRGGRAKAAGAGEQQVLALPPRAAEPAPADEARPSTRRTRVVAAAATTRRTSIAVSTGGPTPTRATGEQPPRPRSTQDGRVGTGAGGGTESGAAVDAATAPSVPAQHAVQRSVVPTQPTAATATGPAPAAKSSAKPAAKRRPSPAASPAASPADSGTSADTAPAGSPSAGESATAPAAAPVESPTGRAEQAKPAATRSGNRATASRAKAAASKSRAKSTASTRAKRGKAETD